MTAATFGVGDFAGGLATRRARVIQVVAWSHVVGGIGAIVASLLLAERFDWGDIGLGIIGGAFGVVGVGLLYRRLAVGPMSVVAPLTAITSAVVPGLWGLAGGDRFGTPGWVGLAVALVAVLLVSSSSDQPEGGSSPVTAQVVIESLAAGAGFGLLFVFFDATGSESAPWPVAGARVFTSTVLLSFLLVVARRQTSVDDGGPASASVVPRDGHSIGLIALAGVADTTANVTFLAATNAGQLTLVSVLASLYPVSTVLLARLV
ncbi:MAG: EamA family transporter, partial [Actinomycetota bacterium]